LKRAEELRLLPPLLPLPLPLRPLLQVMRLFQEKWQRGTTRLLIFKRYLSEFPV
jgi:hypothetical protein